MSDDGALDFTTSGEREIVMVRGFAAPRSRVFAALTTPELLRQWLTGPAGWTMTSCEDDLRPGGSFRYEWRGPDGAEMAMRGTYREVVPPARIVRTETFEFGCDAQSGEQVGTATLLEQNGRTTLNVRVLYPSPEARDATIASGMERGAAASYDKLAALLAK